MSDESHQNQSPNHKSKKALTKSNFLKDFIISGVAASIGKTIIAPMERIKLLLQNQHIINSVKTKYNGILHCANSVVKSEGVLSLWRGNISNVMRYFPNQAFNFAFKDTFKKMFKNYDQKKEFLKFLIANSIAGGLAGATSLFIVCPLDFIRTRLATDNLSIDGKRDFMGTIDCINKIIASEGISGLYKGFVVAMVGMALYRAMYFGLYDSCKGNLITNKTSYTMKFMIAQLITNFSSLCFYPLDTVRRRIMLQSGKAEIDKNYTTSYDCAVKINSQEGMLGFYKGFGANIVRGSGAALVLVFTAQS